MMRVRFPLPAPLKSAIVNNTMTGSNGPFEKVRQNVYEMAMKMHEASVIEKIMKDPTEANMLILTQYIFSDPSWPPKDDLPN